MGRLTDSWNAFDKRMLKLRSDAGHLAFAQGRHEDRKLTYDLLAASYIKSTHTYVNKEIGVGQSFCVSMRQHVPK